MSTGATAGKVATSEGQQGLLPRPLNLGWFLPLLLLGFPTGTRPALQPLSLEPHTRLPTGLGWGPPFSNPISLGGGPATMGLP